MASQGRLLHTDFKPPVYQPPISTLCASPTLNTFDPGGTTGYSVMAVHPEALVDPEVKILQNIQWWTHGEIDCGTRRGNAGNSTAKSSTEIADDEGIATMNGGIMPWHDEEVGDFDGLAISGADPLGISIAGESAGVSEMLHLVSQWPGAAILNEDFLLRTSNMDRDVLSAVRVTAAFEFGCWVLGRILVPRQQPALAKTTVTNDRLKAWGFYKSEGGMRHARDADRHSITFLRRCKDPKEGRALRELAWPHLYGIIRRDGKEIVGPYYIPPPKKKARQTA